MVVVVEMHLRIKPRCHHLALQFVVDCAHRGYAASPTKVGSDGYDGKVVHPYLHALAGILLFLVLLLSSSPLPSQQTQGPLFLLLLLLWKARTPKVSPTLMWMVLVEQNFSLFGPCRRCRHTCFGCCCCCCGFWLESFRPVALVLLLFVFVFVFLLLSVHHAHGHFYIIIGAAANYFVKVVWKEEFGRIGDRSIDREKASVCLSVQLVLRLNAHR